MLAFNIAGSLNYIISPLYNAFYPRFCQLAVSKDYYDSLSSLYHKGCQLMCAAVLPIALIIACYSEQILTLWIRDPVVVENTHVLLSMIVIGTALNAILTMPYALQLAYGYTKIVLVQNVICVIVLAPLLIVLAKNYGAKGAPIVWLLLNTGVFIFAIPAMHRRYMQHEMKKWYVFDVGIPFLTVSLVSIMSYLLLPSASSTIFSAIWISVTLILSTCFCLVVMPAGRGWIRLYLLKKTI
jgi:O-antigen/teichoic acid export membrane protein